MVVCCPPYVTVGFRIDNMFDVFRVLMLASRRQADKPVVLTRVHCQQSLEFLQFVGAMRADCRVSSHCASLPVATLLLFDGAWLLLYQIALHSFLPFCLKCCS